MLNLSFVAWNWQYSDMSSGSTNHTRAVLYCAPRSHIVWLLLFLWPKLCITGPKKPDQWNCLSHVYLLTAVNLSSLNRLTWHVSIFHIYTVSQKKTCHSTFIHNFYKCWPIFKILSLSYSPWNLKQNPWYISHRTLTVLLHYLAKHTRSKIA